MLATAVAVLASCLTASVATTTSASAAPGKCGERNGWIPSGKIGKGIPGITDASLLRFTDLDGDGDDDLALLDEIGGVRAWRNDGTDMAGGGGWAYRGRIAQGTGLPPSRVRFADLDRDGDDDYLVIKDNGAIDGYLNDGGDLARPDGVTSGWRPAGQIARGTGVPVDQIQFGDLDGDGDDDYLAVNSTAPIDGWRNDGGDTPTSDGWSPWGTVRAGSFPPSGLTHMEVRDVTCDGRDDLLLLFDTSALYVFENKGETPGAEARFDWSTLTRYAPGTGDPADRIMLAELDGDGRADYVVMASDGSLYGYLNNGGDQ